MKQANIIRYFIDQDWQYREILLGFEQVSSQHTGQALAQIILQVLKDCGITTEQILSLISDNVRNNGTIMDYLNDGLSILSNDLGI